jgi:predicted nucleic acid-binding protein
MATTAAESSRLNEGALFVDTNVLIYANIVESPFHAAALAALRQARAASRALWISR